MDMSDDGRVLGPLSKLERSVLAWLAEQQDDAIRWRDLLLSASVKERDNSGAGFYTYLDVDGSDLPPATNSRMLEGPSFDVQVPGDILEMGTMLWLEHGKPDVIEFYACWLRSGADIDTHSYDLFGLTLLGSLRAGPE